MNNSFDLLNKEICMETMGQEYVDSLTPEAINSLEGLATSVDIEKLLYDEAKKIDLLSKEEEYALAKRIADGDRSAINELVEHNIRLIYLVVRKLRIPGVETLDMIQDGAEGLIKAAKKFDYKKGNRFSTYAIYWIRSNILAQIKNTGRNIRVPRYIYDELNKIRKTESKLRMKLHKNPSIQEIAEELGDEFSEKKIERILLATSHITSLDKTVGEDGEDTLVNLIADQNVVSPADCAEKKELRELLDSCMRERLSSRELKIMRLRFGFEDGCAWSLEKIGNHFDLSRERVRQIEKASLKKLRAPSVLCRLRGYDDEL